MKKQGWIAGMLLLLSAVPCPAAGDKAQWEPRERMATENLGTNLFLGARTSCSNHWSEQHAGLAVDGNREAESHWAGPDLPSHHTVTLDEPAEINVIRFWPYHADGRQYQWVIEGSMDGTNWILLADMSNNTMRGTDEGFPFLFETTRIRHVRTTFTFNSRGAANGGHIVEIEGYLAASDTIKERAALQKAWEGVDSGLHAAVGSIDHRYDRNAPPDVPESNRAWTATAWRGERIAGHFVSWSANALKQLRVEAASLTGPGNKRIPVLARFVRYVYGKDRLLEDIIDPKERLDVPARTCRPVWVSVQIPGDAVPGFYTGQVVFRTAGEDPIFLNVKIEVLPARLPPPSEWYFHLDLWQHPYAVARFHGVEPWSKEHLLIMKKVLKMGADAGVKCLTIAMNARPWGQQTFDAYDSMIGWMKKGDGTWSYDYSIFDAYVEAADEVGAATQINCYSMVPWGNRFYCTAEETGDLVEVSAPPGSEAYGELLPAFLKDLQRHLRMKGWLDRTCIAMDERSLKDLKIVIGLVKEHAPGLKIALAANHNLAEIIDHVHDYCFYINFKPDRALNEGRTKAGRKTTFYVCCVPQRPNTFPFSPPAESTWLGWYAAAHRYDGFLRWAIDHWNRDPFLTTDYGNWPTGDCFLIYPGPRTSIRFERLREGIQDYEKIRILRATVRDEATLESLDHALAGFVYPRIGSPEELTDRVNRAKKVLEELSRKAH